MLWSYVWPNWHQAFPVPRPVPRTVHHCVSPYPVQIRWVDEGWCGKPVGHVGWNQWSNYCSEECRIRSVCGSMFRILRPHSVADRPCGVDCPVYWWGKSCKITRHIPDRSAPNNIRLPYLSLAHGLWYLSQGPYLEILSGKNIKNLRQ